MPGKVVPFLAVNHRAVGTAAQGSGRIKVIFSGVSLAAVGQIYRRQATAKNKTEGKIHSESIKK